MLEESVEEAPPAAHIRGVKGNVAKPKSKKAAKRARRAAIRTEAEAATDISKEDIISFLTGGGLTSEKAKKFVEENPLKAKQKYILNFVEGNIGLYDEGSLRRIADNGKEVGEFCVIGKSGKDLRSIKFPSALFTRVYAKRPPSPMLFLIQLLGFIWRSAGIGTPPPSFFLKAGLAFFKNMVELPTSTLGKVHVLEVLKRFDSAYGGILAAFVTYKEDRARYNAELAKNTAEKEKLYEDIHNLAKQAFGTLGSAARNFGLILGSAATLFKGAGLDNDARNGLLTNYADTPTKAQKGVLAEWQGQQIAKWGAQHQKSQYTPS